MQCESVLRHDYIDAENTSADFPTVETVAESLNRVRGKSWLGMHLSYWSERGGEGGTFRLGSPVKDMPRFPHTMCKENMIVFSSQN